VSKDPALLAKRKALLKEKGYKTVSAFSKQEAVLRVSNERFSVAVLCQTVGPAEQKEVSKRLLAIQPDLRLLCPKYVDVEPSRLVTMVEHVVNL
jgi:DNA-binding response OmpR family regulator